AAFKLRLPADMVRRRVHDVFHAELLRPHIPNDDERFPKRSWEETATIPLEKPQNAITEIVGHSRLEEGYVFNAKW
ncbi:hypothetical protein AURDEDRAFT_35998, partial [Auricularia subglabra TFB-10046 SS5]